ncbi:MAG: ABC transporter substrate-binding protein [Alphaproteobacteria bacterium]|nr:ABC transporter substrate-binding protein [Alphaproteobacteria bacterium]
MKSNLFLRVIILLFCVLVNFPAYAEIVPEQEAKQWVEEKGRLLLETFGEKDIAKKYAALDQMMLDYIDLDGVSKFVMGRYWRQMNNEQKQTYQDVFKRYALSIYKSFPLDFDSTKIDFEVTRVIPDYNKTSVFTKINLAKNQTPDQAPLSDITVNFILSKNKGITKIIDLKLGESSLILSYRSRFYEMIAQNDEDIDWFLEDLSDIAEAAERTVEENLRETEY